MFQKDHKKNLENTGDIENLFRSNRYENSRFRDNKRSVKKKGLYSSVWALLAALAVGMAGCSGADQEEESTEAQQTAADVSKEKDGILASTDGNLTVQFLDVGQGNSVLAECDGHYMLIDGGAGSASSYVVSFLKKQGVESLDYIVVSHYDDDHLNGVVGALHAFDCDTVIAPDYETDTKIYDSFISVLEEDDLTPIYPEVGETYELGDAMFTIVCPDNYDYSDENDNSVGIRLSYGQTNFLICGDASEDSEKNMVESGIELQSDVYLASHHGSSGASTTEFLEKIQPKAVVISAGYGNSYGHPSNAALERIQKTGADLYRTDLQGELKAVSDGAAITWNVEPSNDFRSGDEVSEDGSAGSKKGTDSQSTKTAGQENAETGNKEPEADTDPASGNSTANEKEVTYIINTNTGKFHQPSCSSVEDMSETNKEETTKTRAELEEQGYSPCKRCLE